VRVDLRIRLRMVKVREGVECLVPAFGLAVPLPGDAARHAPEVDEWPFYMDRHALRQPARDPVYRLVGKALRVDTALPSVELLDESAPDVFIEYAGLLAVGGKAGEKSLELVGGEPLCCLFSSMTITESVLQPCRVLSGLCKPARTSR